MATAQCPPQEELEFKIRGDKPVFQGQIAVAGDITSKWFRDNAYDTDTLALRVTMDSPFGPDVVYTHCEITNPSTRLGLLAGGIQKGTEEYKPLAIDDQGRLCVDAAISIGEVQLDVQIRAEDGDSAGIYGYLDQDINTPIRTNITSDGHLKVTHVGNRDMIIIYDEDTLSGSIEHTVTTHTVGVGERFNLFKVSATGRTNGIFRVRINNSIIESKRNAQSDRNVEFNYSQGYPLSAGDTIDITIFHQEGASKPFTGTIYGESI